LRIEGEWATKVVIVCVVEGKEIMQSTNEKENSNKKKKDNSKKSQRKDGDEGVRIADDLNIKKTSLGVFFENHVMNQLEKDLKKKFPVPSKAMEFLLQRALERTTVK